MFDPPPPVLTRLGRIVLTAMAALAAIALAACTDAPSPSAADTAPPAAQPIIVTEYADLVSAGLGVSGLKAPPPTPANPTEPSPEALRALAIHTQYNNLAAVQTDRGLGGFVDTGLPQVAGVEVLSWLAMPDGTHRSRVLLQIPERFDVDAPCLVAAPASGSRGVYGAVPLVAPWALPKGCAVVYTDKGAGTDYVDLNARTGVALNGQRVALPSDEAGFVPASLDRPGAERAMVSVATPHAHAGVSIEPHWGQLTLQAIDWALARLADRFGPALAPEAVRTLAAGLSNGGAAVLHALEADTDQTIDAAVAVMPNITPPDTAPLYRYAATAALFQPCALGDAAFAEDKPFANPLLIGFGPVRCQNLHAAGLLDTPTPEAAREVLTASGFDDDALVFSAATVALDVWRSVLVNYASAYLGTGADDMPCGYRFDATAASEADKAQWWATQNGTPPSETIQIVETREDTLANDPHFKGLMCLHALVDAPAMQAALASIQARAEWPHAVPVEIVHGQVDALIPAALSARPYVAAATANGMALNYEEIEGAQHFDAFLNALPGDDRWQPILPAGWAAMDRAWADLATR